jgi:glycosyltransferase involved in cell wall biosynthesis
MIFFCGAILNHDGLLKYKGETPAASLWIKGFLSGIMNNGVDVLVFAPVWDSLFPKGRLLPGDSESLDTTISQKRVKYLNIPYLRDKSVAYSLEKAIVREIKSGNIPKVIFNYNTYPYYCSALKKVVKKFPQIPWINIVLDLDDPTVDNWQAFLMNTKGSSGSVFLSWWGYENVPLQNKFHLDGGWSGVLPKVSYSKNKVFLYAGKYNKYGGILDIIEAIKLIRNKEIIFEFYGKGNFEPLQELAKKDKRIHIKGFVSEKELDEACKKAFAFLSPREVNYQGTRMIFPSKILFYLKYQKPIISPKIPGLSPQYNDVLVMPEENSSNAFAEQVNIVTQLSEHELEIIARRSQKLLAQKTWKTQALNLISFIKTI